MPTLSIRDHPSLRALVFTLRPQLSRPRRNDAGARPLARSHDDLPVGSGICSGFGEKNSSSTSLSIVVRAPSLSRLGASNMMSYQFAEGLRSKNKSRAANPAFYFAARRPAISTTPRQSELSALAVKPMLVAYAMCHMRAAVFTAYVIDEWSL